MPRLVKPGLEPAVPPAEHCSIRTRTGARGKMPLPLVSELLNIRRIDRSYCVATWDRVLIQLWRGEATLLAAQQWLEFGEAFLNESGQQPCSSLSIVESRSPPPADKVRISLTASFRGLAPRMLHQIVVGEGSISRSALVRAVGLTLSPVPLEFAVSVDEAALTLAPHLSTASGGADGLKAAVANIRSQIDRCIA